MVSGCPEMTVLPRMFVSEIPQLHKWHHRGVPDLSVFIQEERCRKGEILVQVPMCDKEQQDCKHLSDRSRSDKWPRDHQG